MRKIISLLLVGCLLCSATPLCVLGASDSDITAGFIVVENMKTGLSASYEAITKNDTIYMLPEDIAVLGDYKCESHTVSMAWIKEAFSANAFLSKRFPSFDVNSVVKDDEFQYAVFSRGSSTPDAITEIYYCDGVAKTMGQSYEIDIIDNNGKTYLNMEKMLYLMHAQWCVEDSYLYYYPLDANIFDFVNDYFGYMYEHSVQRSDLLMENENKWGHTIRTVVSHIINTVDMRIFIPIYGSDMISEDWYEEAILQLATTDESFLDDTGINQINSYLADSSYQSIETELKVLEGGVDSIVELPSRISESKLNKFSRWNELSDIDTSQLEGIQDDIDVLGDVVTAAQILTDYYEISTRSSEWSDDFVDGLWALYAIDEDVHGEHGEYIVNVSSDLLDEFDQPSTEATKDAVADVCNWIFEKLVEDTLFGQATNSIECVIALSNVILKSVPEFATQIEVADLMNTVHALINVENILLYEFADEYVDFEHYVETSDGGTSSLRLWELMYAPFNKNPQTVTTQNAISDMRTTLEMFLKASLRNKTYVYHFGCFNNGDGWEYTPPAQELRQDISKTYALLSELIATRDYDKLLVLDSFDKMYSDEYGCVRTEIKASTIRLNSESSDGEDAQSAEYNGHRYMVFHDDSIGWHDAKEACEEMGGHLVTITSQEENDFVFSLVKGESVSFWLGATDEENEGDWKWVTNEPWNYNNSSFDNRNDVQHYLVINHKNEQTWDDQSEKSTSQNGFLCDTGGYICEWDTTLLEHNGHRYQLFEVGKTWPEAKAYCESLGGHLLTITSQEEQDFVQTLLATGTKNSYWLGAKKSSDFQWITGEPFTYTNWNDGMPDNRNGNEDSLMIYRGQNPWVRNAFGEWNDLKFDGTCNNEAFFGLEDFGFICEWENNLDQPTTDKEEGSSNDFLSKRPLADHQSLFQYSQSYGFTAMQPSSSSAIVSDYPPAMDNVFSVTGDFDHDGNEDVIRSAVDTYDGYAHLQVRIEMDGRSYSMDLCPAAPTAEAYVYVLRGADEDYLVLESVANRANEDSNSHIPTGNYRIYETIKVYGIKSASFVTYEFFTRAESDVAKITATGRIGAQSMHQYLYQNWENSSSALQMFRTEKDAVAYIKSNLDKIGLAERVLGDGNIEGAVIPICAITKTLDSSMQGTAILYTNTPDKLSDDGQPSEGAYAGNQTAEQLMRTIIGTWGMMQDYTFTADGSCYFYGDTSQGTYTITDDRTLTIEFPWTSKKYVWSELSFDEFHKDNDSSIYFWCITEDGVLCLNGTAYYRGGVIPLD